MENGGPWRMGGIVGGTGEWMAQGMGGMEDSKRRVGHWGMGSTAARGA